MVMTTKGSARVARIGLPLLATAAFAAACGTSTSTGSSGHPAQSTLGAAGPAGASIELSHGHLTDGTGRTVYLWVADSPNTSHCTSACTTVWPPVTAAGQPTPGSGLTAAQLTTIKRPDGTTQLAYAGHPLYYYAPDSTVGDTKGQGSNSFGARWWELSSTGQPITTATTPNTPGSTPATSVGSGAYGD